MARARKANVALKNGPKSSGADSLRSLSDPRPQRGSVVLLRVAGEKELKPAVIVSNNIQNDISDFLLAVPLIRRASRLSAPFSVDLGREDGFRDLHTARCDWVSRVSRNDIVSIERAALSEPTVERFESALRVSLGFRETI